MSRPEHQAPPDLFYNEEEAKKYAQSSRMIEVQTNMAHRALELLNLPPRPCYLLDIGCGSGLSGEAITEAGHEWVGVDISSHMLGVARTREVEGDLVCSDMGHGMMFRPGVFDGVISISAIQWLCTAYNKQQIPQRRLKTFFQSLYNCMSRGARAVFQLYPESPAQMKLITAAARRVGFTGGLVVDYPNSSLAKKIYLCLNAGTPPPERAALPAPRTELDPQFSGHRARAGGDGDDDDDDEDGNGETNGEEADYDGLQPFDPQLQPDQAVFSARRTDGIDARAKSRERRSSAHTKGAKGSREWILAKKERRRLQGRATASDSKYTARKRNVRF